MKRDNTLVFEQYPVPKAVLTMAIPTIISQLIVLFYNMADTFFIGRTGNPCMVAAASLILPVFNIALSFSGLSGVGGGSLISRLLGRRQAQDAQSVFNFSVWLGIATAAFFSILVLIFIKPLLFALGAGPDTFEFAKSYTICVVVLGCVPTVLSNTFSHLLRSTGDSDKAGFGIAFGGIINMALDPLFMFVLLPEGKEVLGAGIATLLSNCIACVYFIVVIKKKNDQVLRLSSPFDIPAGSLVKELFSVGVPSSIVTLFCDFNFIVLNKLMSSYGDIALAAFGIVHKVERLPLNIGVGICQGMVPIVAYNYAAKNYERMKATKHFAMFLGLFCGIACVIIYELFAPQIMRFFISDAQTVLIGTKFMKIRILATPLMFMSFFHVNVFNALGQGRYSLCLGVTRWLVLNTSMLFVLNSLIGMYGLLWGQAISDSMAVLLSVIVYAKFKKTHLNV